nr:immunoglobulin light chain junction region [Macaca mulatta]
DYYCYSADSSGVRVF